MRIGERRFSWWERGFYALVFTFFLWVLFFVEAR